MNTLAKTTELVRLTTELVKLKNQAGTAQFRRAVSYTIHQKQVDNTQAALTSSLAKVFEQQIRSATRILTDLSDEKASGSVQAEALTDLIFSPEDWVEPTIDAAFPVVARSMGEAAIVQLLSLGFDVKTTGSEWLDNEGETLPPGVSAKWPQWLIDSIEVELSEVFEQDFWKKIPKTTRDDIETYLRVGIQDGKSTKELAAEMHRKFPKLYSRKRAQAVAETESANSLNAGRKLSSNKLREEFGEQLPLKAIWLSALLNTTRDAHANLDGVPEDGDGMWNLNGVRVPWPAHYSLPPGDRVRCRCTTTVEFGMSDSDAQQVISEFNDRVG